MADASAPSLTQLAQWLAGEFSNQAQALEQPTWFVNLKLWHRPLPQRLDGHLALFAEQAPAIALQQPYRQRLFTLEPSSDGMRAQYYRFKQPERFLGAGQDPNRLDAFTLAEVERLPGCVLHLVHTGSSWTGTMAAGDRCRFQYQDARGQPRTGQVMLGFEVWADRFFSHDRGLDPETERPIWGALMGPYQFEKIANFSDALPLDVS